MLFRSNAIGQNTGFPQAVIVKGAYATPWQTPISRNMIEGSGDTAVDPITGQMKFADGESIKSVQRRTIETLLAYDDRKHRNILISTHADVIKLAIFHALDVPISNLDKLIIDYLQIHGKQ